MLLPREIPPAHQKWNRRWRAPHGNAAAQQLVRRRRLEARRIARRAPQLLGLFALQSNNDIRSAEYPWAFHAVDVRRGMRVVDIGGALSGFQFVLDRCGAHVINVDPSEGGYGGLLPLNDVIFARCNRAFRTEVELRRCTLEQAALPSDSVDVAYSISTIEHIDEDQLPSLMREIARVVRPGGHTVLTIDLFLDLAPFTSRTANRWGRNVDVAALVEASGLELVIGDPSQLVGFEAFDPDAVQQQLADHLVGSGYPVCAQALVLRKS